MNTIEEYRSFLAKVRSETGIEAFAPDEGGLVSLSVDDRYTVNLQFVEATGKVLCFIELMRLPSDSPKAVYRDLLVGGLFGKDTAGGYFALEPETETVVYNYFFDLDKIATEVSEFISTLEKMLQLCDIWVARITSGEVADQGDTDKGQSVKAHDFIAV